MTTAIKALLYFLIFCFFSFKGISQTNLVATLLGHSGAVNSIDISPDEKTLISGSKDETIRVWNLEKKELDKSFNIGKSSVKSVTFNSDGSKFLAALYTKFIEVDFKTFKGKSSKKNSHTTFIEACRYSNDGNLILTSSWRDNSLVIWNASNFKKKTVTKEVTWVDNAIFNKNASLIYSGGHDNLVKIWDVNTGDLIKELAGHDDWVYDLCLSANENTLYSCSLDKTIKLWDISTGKNTNTLKGHTDGVICLDISKDGKYLASGGMDKSIIIWDLTTNTEVLKLTGHDATVMDVKFSNNGNYLYSCSLDKTIKIWNVEKK